MQFIQGNNRHQTYFSPLEDQVITDNAVRLMDALLISWGYSNLVSVKSKSEGRPPYAPAVLVNGEMNLIMFC